MICCRDGGPGVSEGGVGGMVLPKATFHLIFLPKPSSHMRAMFFPPGVSIEPKPRKGTFGETMSHFDACFGCAFAFCCASLSPGIARQLMKALSKTVVYS